MGMETENKKRELFGKTDSRLRGDKQCNELIFKGVKMNIEKTSCYAFFLIKSAGKLDYFKGVIPEENSAFYPNVITKMLGIEPFDTRVIGTLKPNGKSRYNFSSWFGCKQTEPKTSRFDQCSKIVEELKPHIPELRKIKKMYNVYFSIEIYPFSANDERVIGFSHDVIEFCY